MLNDKQESFCRMIIEGHSQAEAYRRSHPSAAKWKDETVWVKASQMAAIDTVSTRIAELRAEAAKRNEITVDDLIAELEEARQVALSAETPQTSAAIAGTMGKAKLLGMDKQVIEHTGKEGKPLFDKIEIIIVNAQAAHTA